MRGRIQLHPRAGVLPQPSAFGFTAARVSRGHGGSDKTVRPDPSGCFFGGGSPAGPAAVGEHQLIPNADREPRWRRMNPARRALQPFPLRHLIVERTGGKRAVLSRTPFSPLVPRGGRETEALRVPRFAFPNSTFPVPYSFASIHLPSSSRSSTSRLRRVPRREGWLVLPPGCGSIVRAGLA